MANHDKLTDIPPTLSDSNIASASIDPASVSSVEVIPKQELIKPVENSIHVHDNDSNLEVARLEIANLLLEDNYSIEALIRQAQKKGFSLDELRNQLMTHQTDLNQTSLQLFDNNYVMFYKLSQLVTCSAEPIEMINKPIESYRDKLEALCREHDSYLSQIDEKITRLEEINKNKQLASKLIALIKRGDRLFNQVENNNWLRRDRFFSFEQIIKEAETEQTLDHRLNCEQIERLSIELYFLFCETSAIHPTSDELIPIKQSLLDSIMKHRKQIIDWLKDLFHESMRDQSKFMIEYVLQIFNQTCDNRADLDLEKYFQEKRHQFLNVIDECLKNQPLGSALRRKDLSVIDQDCLKIRICEVVFDQVSKCWTTEIYIEYLDYHFSEMACSIIEKFAEWLSKLRLSDFRITDPIAAPVTDGSRTVINFLAKQNAIMQMLVDDCTNLIKKIKDHANNNLPNGAQGSQANRDMLFRSLDRINDGLRNLRSLQNLFQK